MQFRATSEPREVIRAGAGHGATSKPREGIRAGACETATMLRNKFSFFKECW